MTKLVKITLYSKEEIYCILLKETKVGIYYKNNYTDRGFIPIDEIKHIDLIGEVIR